MANEETLKNGLVIDLADVSKTYKVGNSSFFALNGVSLHIDEPGIVSILGPSGCGKTTLLNVIGGLDHPTSGDFSINGIPTCNYKSKDWDSYRNQHIGFVFQNYNLIAYKNVLENVQLPLEIAGANIKLAKKKALAALDEVGLRDLAKKKPNQLSGGQMQRVAIARAIVNEPSLILADEPTGALDSESSVTVLELLKRLSLKRPVVLVTHNRELALRYSDRILEMKDGKIIKDSKPCQITRKSEKEPVSAKNNKHMTWVSALSSTGHTLLSKKARITLTALSCSFGVLGVALVLAINNGFSDYVSKVERSVASSVPISLSPVTTRTYAKQATSLEEFPNNENVNVYTSNNSYSEVIYNNFSDEYFSYLDAIMNDPKCSAYGSAMSVMYYRKDFSYHFMKEDPSGSVRLINQYKNASASSYTIASLTSLPGTILHELYGDEGNMSSLYDTIAGKFPTEANELALILDSYNRIDFSTMKELGFYSSDAVLDDDNCTLTFDQMLGAEFKCYTNSEYYGVHSLEELERKTKNVDVSSYNSLSLEISDSDGDGQYEAVVSDNDTDDSTKQIKTIAAPSGEEVFKDETNHKPIKCKIVGILRPTKNSYLQLMPASLAYTPALSKLLVADHESPAIQRMAEYQQNDWVIPRIGGKTSWGFDGKERIAAAMDCLASAFTKIKKSGSLNDGASDLANFKDKLNSAFCFPTVNGYNETKGTFSYYTAPSAYLNLCRNFGATFPKADFESVLLEASLNGSLAFGPDFFNGVSEVSIIDYLASLNAYSLVDSILIFPASLTTKGSLTSYLNAWNTLHPNEQNTYVDIMADFTSSLGSVVQILSVVLVVFASISLLVSSIMTAIITYVSVVERTKEIGVLRSCGARKTDIGRLFELECLFVGLVAGCLGVILSWVASIPANRILNNMFPSNHLGSIVSLRPTTAVILVLISMALSFVSGFIPSRMAATKDPVVCLRSEQ